ncbi:MAG TPA: HAD-IA family hydrolase [Candidatus Saccharimonadales bacterium]|nr:HAD-IA family hydrolase [Candidatus Saccharimonadales bacterium]
MIKAIIFDCFGVLTSDGWLPFKKQHFGNDRELESQATDLSKQLNSGYLSAGDFMQQIAALAGVSPEQARRAIERNAANEELFDYISSSLKGRYKLAILSNAGANQLRQLFTPEQIDLFDHAALSYETGYVKPDGRAYQHVSDLLGVQPEECIFVDDQQRHCTGACEAGMQAVCYQDFEQARAELEAALSA